MKHFEDKRQVMSKVYSRLTVCILVLVVMFMGNGVYNIFVKQRESARVRLEAEKKLEGVRDQKDNLVYEMDKLSSDTGVEEKIRTKFNFVRPGEHVVVIVRETPTTTATTSPGFFTSLWQKIWQ